ncbi:unnamed protein product [Prorocentrum cordatum]|uniref:Phytanoyl-CoA dioxygenase family protein n=1 Tax=Prorocentrum cordatum TaxID=2364126 RepID=A0ABN9WWE7_9DINO|nr:unnamed protein product [Polarella glacialis]
MQVVDAAHSSGQTVNHACCVGGTWYVEAIPEEFEATLGCDMAKDVITCEVPLGSVLFLNNLIPHRSLPNLSDGIRWSLDLRWQRGGEPNGFSGIKESVLMKRPGDMGSYRADVDWGDWASTPLLEAAKENRSLSEEQRASVEAVGRAEGRFDSDPALDTTIVGPWMHRWGKVLHHNRHTEAAEAAMR